MATTAQRQEVAAGAAGRKRGFRLTPYLFIVPHLIFFAIFVAYPFFYGLYVSFYQYDFLRPAAARFIGLGNYVELFTPGTVAFPVFWNSLVNTLEFVVYSVPLLVIIPLGLAILLNTRTPGRNFFRALFYAPNVLSAAVAGLLGFWVFQSSGGLVNFYMVDLGLSAPRWLSSLPWAWLAIVLTTLWWTLGFNMIILLAALQEIPDHLYEAAAIDGATGMQAFFRITIPLLRSVLVFIITISIIASFNLFAQPFFMTNGGPAQAGGGGATESVMMRIYNQGFVRNQLGSASAMSFVTAAMMIAFSYINFRVFRRRD